VIPRFLFLLALATALAGCGDRNIEEGAQSSDPSVATTESPDVATRTRPSVEEAAAGTYYGILDQPIMLVGGLYEGPPFVEDGASRPRVELIRDFELSGDLNGDGLEETIVLLAESSGGSGTFGHLAVLARQDGRATNIGTAPLGDRVQIRDRVVDGDTIVLDVVQAGPEDAACCPSQLVTRRWTLGPEGLNEGAAEIRGALSLAVLEDVEWRLVSLNGDVDAPEEPAITLIFYGDKVGGTSGCNRYMGASTTGQAPGDLSFGPLAGTMMACSEDVMDLEQQFLNLMGQVTRFSFHLGKLGLTSVDEAGNVHVLLFESHPIPAGNG